jgi:hypothetical protein
MYLALLQTVEDDDGFHVSSGEVLFWLIVVLIVVAIVYLVQRIR